MFSKLSHNPKSNSVEGLVSQGKMFFFASCEPMARFFVVLAATTSFVVTAVETSFFITAVTTSFIVTAVTTNFVVTVIVTTKASWL